VRPARLSAALVLPAALVLSACSSATAEGGARVAVTASEGSCEIAQTSVPAGVVTFSVTNTGSGATELYVYDASGTTILSEVENVGPGVTRDLVVELAEGSAVVGCRPDDASDLVRTDLAVTASGATAAAQTSPAIAAAVERYRAYVAAESDALLERTTDFVAAVKAGDVEAAKAAYPEARTHWERIEPVAEVFADLDPALDARENDVEPGAEWTGWHRIEKALWVEGSTAGMAPIADKLLADTTTLVGLIPTVELTASNLGNGAAALLEEVAEGKVTGEEERYSRTDLWDFQANVEGAYEAYDALADVLREKDAELDRTLATRFDALFAELGRHADGDGFVAYDTLTPAQVRALADKVDALAEPLSQVTGVVVR